jgi:hypothetical protein
MWRYDRLSGNQSAIANLQGGWVEEAETGSAQAAKFKASRCVQ